jgi:hypothetical protein
MTIPFYVCNYKTRFPILASRINPDISFEPVSGYPWETVERQESLVFCLVAKVSKPNASE